MLMFDEHIFYTLRRFYCQYRETVDGKRISKYATYMNIIVKNALVEVYHFMKMIENYHRLLRQIYSIITTKILFI